MRWWDTAGPGTEDKLRFLDQTARVFLPCGKPPQTGDIFRNPELAGAYRLLAEEGPESFYTGRIGGAILKTSHELGGTMTAEDLACYSSEWVEPISIDYRGWRVFELPPNGQGMAALEMLNIMETVAPDSGGAFAPANIHQRIEAMKLAFSDVYRYNGDPRVAKSAGRENSFRNSTPANRAALIDPTQGQWLHTGWRRTGERNRLLGRC